MKTKNEQPYAAEYLHSLFTRPTVEQPDHNRLNGYGNSLKALYQVHQEGGPEAVRDAWSKAKSKYPDLTTLEQQAGLKRHFLHVSLLKNLPPLEWLVEGMIPKSALCEIHGAPGAGKSLLALHLAATIAVEQSVIYFAGEGVSGYPNRVKAEEAVTHQQAHHLYFDFHEINLMNNGEVSDLISAVKPLQPVLIVFDTLARCMTGGDENSVADMSIVIKACDRIRHETGTAILLVHHTGKSGSSERGSSALRGGCDSMIELTNDDGLITVASSKLKDGKPFATYYMEMVEMEGSVALIPSERTLQDKGNKLSESARKVLHMLELDIYREAGAKYTRIIDHTNVRGSTLDRVLSLLKRRGYITQAKKGEPYMIAEKGLQALNHAK